MNLLGIIKNIYHNSRSKKIILPSLVAGILLSLSSCSEEVIDNTGGDTGNLGNGSLFVSLRVVTPREASSRATYTDGDGTSTDGTHHPYEEDPTDIENQLASAVIYFVSEDSETGEQIELALQADERYPATESGGATLTYEVEDVSSLVGLAGKSGSIYIVANSTESALDHNFSKEIGKKSDPAKATFTTLSLLSAPIGSFGDRGKINPLLNAKKGPMWRIPDGGTQEEKIDNVKAMFDELRQGDLWWDLNETSNPLDLERGVARLEYKDKRPDSMTDAGFNKENVFEIGNPGNIFIELYAIAPFNVNKESYLFRHGATGDARKASGKSKIFGVENSGNNTEIYPEGSGYTWISNPDWVYDDTANEYSFSAEGRSLINPLSLTPETKNAYLIGNNDWGPNEEGVATDPEGTVKIADLDKQSYASSDEFKPWAYVSENTLYSTELMEDWSQDEEGIDDDLLVAKNATGIAFKFLLLGKDGNPLEYIPDGTANSGTPGEEATRGDEEEGEPEETPLTYPDNITNSVSDEAGERWITITDPATSEWIDLKPEKVTVKTTFINDEGEEEEREETKEYYFLKYIACIVHNDAEKEDGDPIPPMYYGVVRNNTYQLTINSIRSLPLPQQPRTVFLRMDVNVISWARVDNDNVELEWK